MTHYQKIRADLYSKKMKWLPTGVASFIGSKLLEELLNLDQEVVGLDNLATGHRKNLEEVEGSVLGEMATIFLHSW